MGSPYADGETGPSAAGRVKTLGRASPQVPGDSRRVLFHEHVLVNFDLVGVGGDPHSGEGIKGHRQTFGSGAHENEVEVGDGDVVLPDVNSFHDMKRIRTHLSLCHHTNRVVPTHGVGAPESTSTPVPGTRTGRSAPEGRCSRNLRFQRVAPTDPGFSSSWGRRGYG
jgi:hypothetical protein